MKCRLEESEYCLKCKARHCNIGLSLSVRLAKCLNAYKELYISAGVEAGQAIHNFYDKISKIDWKAIKDECGTGNK